MNKTHLESEQLMKNKCTINYNSNLKDSSNRIKSIFIIKKNVIKGNTKERNEEIEKNECY